MKARRLVVLALALVTVVTMGIGYAALNDALFVNGTGTIQKAAADNIFDDEVYFTGTPVVEKCTAVLVEGSGDTAGKPDSATITIDNSLAIVGDMATAKFTVTNESDVPVSIVTNTSADSDHFRVTAEYGSANNTIPAGGNIDVTVKIVLKQTVSADVSESFSISFNVSSAG